MEISVSFHTNLDCPVAGGWTFPKKVLVVPRLGDKVKSYNGPVLTVCSIVHCERSQYQGEPKPCIEIELTKNEWFGKKELT